MESDLLAFVKEKGPPGYIGDLTDYVCHSISYTKSLGKYVRVWSNHVIDCL